MRESFIVRATLVFLVSNVYFGAALDPLVSPTTLKHDRQENVPHSYLVQLRAGTSQAASALHHEWLRQLTSGLAERSDFELVEQPNMQTSLRHRQSFKGVTNNFDLNDDFRGYAIHTDDFVVDRIREHPDVSK